MIGCSGILSFCPNASKKVYWNLASGAFLCQTAGLEGKKETRTDANDGPAKIVIDLVRNLPDPLSDLISNLGTLEEQGMCARLCGHARGWWSHDAGGPGERACRREVMPSAIRIATLEGNLLHLADRATVFERNPPLVHFTYHQWRCRDSGDGIRQYDFATIGHGLGTV